MKIMPLFLLLSLCLLACQQPSESHLLEHKIDEIINSMTLEEKIGQTAMRGASSRGKIVFDEGLKTAVREGRIGSMLNMMNTEYLDELQRIAVEESPHGIPILFARDVIHGFKTIFPIPLGMAASWDTTVAKNSSIVAAREATPQGIRWTFAPMVDICRDSRWGRVAESPGEDPFLAALLSEAYVHGFQGDDPSQPTSLTACAKHFAGYGAAIGGRDYNTAIIHESLLRNVYLPPFESAVEAGALTFMTSFNEINGIPATGNEFLLDQVLRKNWNFDGLVVSDWASITEMINHGFAADARHAAQLSALAGTDIEMMTKAYDNHLKELVQSGEVPEQQLDFLVRNILRVKLKMGLFDQPYRPKGQPNTYYATEHLELARQAAIKGSVLLKNDGLLPLSVNTKIALIGPLADAPHEQLGTWTFDGEEERTITPKDYFESQNADFQYAAGLAYSRDKSTAGFQEALQAASNADVVVYVAGEEAILSGEAHSRADIRLPGAQEKLFEELEKTGKPIVLVIMAGRPISFFHYENEPEAVLMMWHPGTMGGQALYEMLFGIVSPEGRLPLSWPKMAGQLPLFYNHKATGRPADSSSFVQIDDIPVKAWQSSLGNKSHYLDAGFTPHYPFGYGLTFTEFEYEALELDKQKLRPSDVLEAKVKVTNKGDRAGKEVVQLYVRDRVGSITRPVRELKGFQHVELEPGASQIITF